MLSLSSENFKSSKVNPLIKKDLSFESIEKSIKDNFNNGLIDEDLRDKALQQLDAMIEKGGEGSKGGHVIGHTKSGKPVYAKGNSKSEDFSSQDHKDAARFHSQEGDKHRRLYQTESNHEAHGQLARHHEELSNSHYFEADQKGKEESSKTLSPDEKKIIADQKKKQKDYHLDMAEHHATQIKSLEELKKKHNHPDLDQEIRMHYHRKDEHSIAHRKLWDEISGKD